MLLFPVSEETGGEKGGILAWLKMKQMLELELLLSVRPADELKREKLEQYLETVCLAERVLH